MSRIRTPMVLALVVGALSITGPADAALPKLFGTVGPGFTITLNRFGKPLKTLRAGTYRITVADRSNIHNFHLRGPGVNREITEIAFKGFKTIVVKLSKGTYTFVCDPHVTMKGKFKVV